MISTIIAALKLIYQRRTRFLWTLGLFLPIFVLYIFLLPSSVTGGKIGLFSLKFLTPLLVFFAFALSFFFAIILTFIAYSISLGVKAAGSRKGIGAMILAVFPGLLCCSPFIPSLLAVLGASTPLIFGISGPIQGFFAQYSLYFYIASLAIVIWAFYLSAKNLVAACKVNP